MIKRILTIGALLCSVPVLANAASWSLNTWVKSPGGFMTSRTNANQTSANGSVFKTYTTHAVLPVTITANPGYTITSVTGTNTPVSSTSTSWSGTVQGMTSQSVYATFGAANYSETATVTSGGTVTPASYSPVYYGTQVSPQVFSFTPNPGYALFALTITGATASCSTDGGTTYATCAAPYAQNIAVKVKVSSITGNATLAGTYAGPPIANAGLSQTALVGQSVSLAGSASSGTSPYTYSWAQAGGPATVVYTAGPAAQTAKFNAPSATGAYSFNLTVTDANSMTSTSSITVNVATSATAAAYGQCIVCHNANNVGGAGAAVTLYNNWSSSMHSRSTHSICSACHVGTTDGGHPGTVNANNVDPATFVTTVAGVNGTLAQGAIFCTYCHNGAYPIPHPTTTLTATCAGCHTGTNGSNGTGDAHSIKDFTTVSMAEAQCQNCHGGIAADATKIVANYNTSVHKLGEAFASSCAGCHGGSAAAANHPANGTYSAIDPKLFTSPTAIMGGEGTLVPAGGIYCASCHKGAYAIPHPTNLNAGIYCSTCHTDPLGQGNGTGDAHSIQPLPQCIQCHAVQQAQVAPGLVNDNNGVRSITQEFAKWSHHVTGVALNDAHCAACHLEGKVSNGAIAVDSTKHMVDGIVHLRNAHDDTDMSWDPANPNHTTMDNFCMSCHSATGATSTGSAAIQAVINTGGIAAPGKVASAKNPFGDTISNRYDKMQRPGVTNVDNQFDTGNNSHHGVKGPRYSGRTRLAGARQIASPGTFANNSSTTLQGVRSTIYDAGNLNQLYTPLANTGGETAPRTGAATLGDDSTLHCGDCHTVGQWKVGSSTIASGAPTPIAIGAHGSNNEYLLRNNLGTDQRHTQNAFLVGTTNGSVTMPNPLNGAVAYDPITGANLNLAAGAAIPWSVVAYTNPNGAFLVCYNCHSYSRYGSIYLGTGLDNGISDGAPGQPHAGEYDQAGRCNGIGNTLPFNGYTTGTATDGTQFASRFMGPVSKYSAPAAYVGEQDPDFGNIFGIQCLNCHNSGIGNAYGGIHGSANDTSWNNGTTTITPASLGAGAGGYYINGMGNATKVERFLPGLGDAMHTPGTLGGVTGGTVVPINTTIGPNYTYTTGGITNDTNWEQKQWQQTAATVINGTTGVVTGTASAGAGCYTLGATVVAPANIIKSDVTSGLAGPSVTGEGGAATEATDTWGGCDDHTAGQAKGNHGFLKRIVRPVTY